MPGHGKSGNSAPEYFYQTHTYAGNSITGNIAWLSQMVASPPDLVPNPVTTMPFVNTDYYRMRHATLAACETEIVSISVQVEHERSLLAVEIVSKEAPFGNTELLELEDVRASAVAGDVDIDHCD